MLEQLDGMTFRAREVNYKERAEELETTLIRVGETIRQLLLSGVSWGKFSPLYEIQKEVAKVLHHDS